MTMFKRGIYPEGNNDGWKNILIVKITDYMHRPRKGMYTAFWH